MDNSKIKPIGITALVVLGAGITFTLVQRAPESSARQRLGAEQTSKDEASSDATTRALTREIKHMKAQMEDMRVRLEGAEANAHLDQPPHTQPALAEGHEPAPSEVEAPSPRSQAEREKLYADLSRHNFEEALREEPRDVEWAASKEKDIKTAIAERYESRLTSVECASTLCRTIVDHGTDEGRRSFIERLVGDTTFGTSCFFMPTDQGIGTQVFCAREGKPLPSVDPELIR